MIEYSVASLYSGSKGNCTLIRSGSASILIDAGKSARSLTSALRSLGSDIESIDAIFITHEHSDHISALPTLLKKHGIPVHIVQASARRMLERQGADIEDKLCIHSPLFCVSVGDMTVTSFPTPHDSAFSVGYRIDIGEGEERVSIGYATDVGVVTDSVRDGLLGCESVVLEANHDVGMLMDGPYPYQLKMRIRSSGGHLSNGECSVLAAELCANGTKNILLAHLSEENNDPSLAYGEVISAVADSSVSIRVASPSDAVILI